MKYKKNCDCEVSEQPVDEQIKILANHMRRLTRQLVNHMNEDPADAGARNRSRRLAAELERIIGGRSVDPGTFPECCLIGRTSGGGFLRSWFCTGTLIHPRVVITAEHCIMQATGSINPNSIGIGVDNEGDVENTNIIRVGRIVRHPTEDVALLILQKTSTIAPVQRATAEETADADRVELVGFGNNDPAGLVGFGTKRQVNVPMNVVRKTPDENLSQAEAMLGFNSMTEFVAGRKGAGQDSCNGDSGGPAYVMVDGTRKLAGATSRATDEADDNCGDGGIYIRVDMLTDWIDEVTSSVA